MRRKLRNEGDVNEASNCSGVNEYNCKNKVE